MVAPAEGVLEVEALEEDPEELGVIVRGHITERIITDRTYMAARVIIEGGEGTTGGEVELACQLVKGHVA